MSKNPRRILFALICACAVLAAGASLADHHLESSTQVLAAADDTVAADDAATAPGCPNAAAGAPCCATCQDRAKRADEGAEVAGATGECPCQRSKRLREKAAAEAAK
jgi:hypothetical protein